MLKKILAALAAVALSTSFVVATSIATADAAHASTSVGQCVVDVIHHPAVAEVDSYRYKQTTTIYTIEHKQVKYTGTDTNVLAWLNSHGTSLGGGVWTLSDQTVNDAGVNPLAPGIFYDGAFSSAHTVNLTAYGYSGGGNSTVQYTITGIDISTTPPAGSFVKSSSPVTIYYVHGGSPTATLGASNWTTDVNPAGWTLVDSRVDTAHQDAYDENVYGACPTVVPQAPVVKDLCGTANDHYGLPTGPTGVAYSRDGLDVIATITAASTDWGTLPTGWVSNPDGTATFAFGNTTWTDVACFPLTVCTSPSTFATSTNLDPEGWSLKPGVTGAAWVAGGLSLDATVGSGSSWAIKTLPAGTHLSQIGDLLTTLVSSSGPNWGGVILEGGDLTDQVHYDADGRFWTAESGIYSAVRAGYYQSFGIDGLGADVPGAPVLLSDPLVGTIKIYVNEGQKVVVGSQSYDCGIQPFDFVPTTVTVSADPGSAATCAAGSLVNGSVNVNLKPGMVEYTITGGPDNVNFVATDAASSLPPGTYTVTPTALTGYVLSGPTSWQETIDDPSPCLLPCDELGAQAFDAVQLDCIPTLVDWPSDAVATQPTCVGHDGSLTVGIDFGVSFFDKVDYFLDGVPITSQTMSLAPGSYTVTASPKFSGDGLSGPSSFPITITPSTLACADLKTLALTGSSPTGGFELSFGLLAAGMALVAMRLARRRRGAQQ